MWRGHSILCPQSENVRGHVPRVLHLIAPMTLALLHSTAEYWAPVWCPHPPH